MKKGKSTESTGGSYAIKIGSSKPKTEEFFPRLLPLTELVTVGYD